MPSPANEVAVQVAATILDHSVPSTSDIRDWVNNALSACADSSVELSVRIVDVAEMSELNNRYRGKSGATNVLSFAVEVDQDLPAELLAELPLGDIVICHPVVVDEANQQGKLLTHHYAHMTTHGVLHLCGFDHLEDKQAKEMEALEAKLLAKLSIPNPYV